MKYEISMTNSSLKIIVDCEDYDRIKLRNWHLMKGGYASCLSRKERYVEGKRVTLLLHREVLGIPHGIGQVDHINGDKLDCRKVNLRKCSPSQNAKNVTKPRDNTSGYKGVSFRKDRGNFRAYIMSDKKQYRLGVFDNAEDAAKAYDVVAIKLHGEYAKLNFPHGGSYL
jgi:hypothetical protein